MKNDFIFHICRIDEWEHARKKGIYGGSSQDIDDGYIHFSTYDQVQKSASKHRAGQDNLVIVTVEAKRLGDALKWESSRDGLLFPHLYADLQISDVVKVDNLLLDAAGNHIFPSDFNFSEG